VVVALQADAVSDARDRRGACPERRGHPGGWTLVLGGAALELRLCIDFGVVDDGGSDHGPPARPDRRTGYRQPIRI
jgi:hypothetical protein